MLWIRASQILYADSGIIWRGQFPLHDFSANLLKQLHSVKIVSQFVSLISFLFFPHQSFESLIQLCMWLPVGNAIHDLQLLCFSKSLQRQEWRHRLFHFWWSCMWFILWFLREGGLLCILSEDSFLWCSSSFFFFFGHSRATWNIFLLNMTAKKGRW